MGPHVKLFRSLFGQKDPKETVKAQNRTPFFPIGAGPATKVRTSMGLKLSPKLVRHFTHRDDPTVGAKTDRLNLLCIQLF